jgi:hypothetical protein
MFCYRQGFLIFLNFKVTPSRQEHKTGFTTVEAALSE